MLVIYLGPMCTMQRSCVSQFHTQMFDMEALWHSAVVDSDVPEKSLVSND